jgi:hypothetical protein
VLAPGPLPLLGDAAAAETDAGILTATTTPAPPGNGAATATPTSHEHRSGGLACSRSSISPLAHPHEPRGDGRQILAHIDLPTTPAALSPACAALCHRADLVAASIVSMANW